MRGFDLSDHSTASAGGAAEVADAEPCALQRLAALAVHLADDDGGKGRVLEGQDFTLTTGDEAFLCGRLLNGIPGRRLQFRYFVPAIFYFGENDLSACVRKVGAEVVELTGVGVVAAIPDLELGTLDGITGDAIQLADFQTGLESVEEGDGRGFAGLQCHFLRDGAENDMVGNIDLRYFECANRNRVEENPPMVIGRGAGRKAAVDLLDTESDALDRLSVGNVFLQNFKSGLFVVHKGDLGGFTGAQRHGLLRIAHNVRLWHRFFPYYINICRNGRERCGTVRAGSNGRGEVARDRLNGEHRPGNRLAAHGVALDDLHIGQCVIFCHNGILLVAISGIDIDAEGRGVRTEALRGLNLNKGPQAFCDILDFNDAAIHRHITTNDLTVAVDVKFSAVQAAGGAGGYLF